MADKIKRNKIAWSDDLSYDSEEEREKERLLNAELAEIEAPEKPSYSDEELNTLVSYVKRMTTLCYLKNDDWNTDCLQIIKDFFLDPKNMLLTIYYHEGKLKSSLEIPTEPVLDLTYFLRKPDSIFTVDKFHNEVTCGTIAGNIEKCLLRTLECIYAPLIFNTKQWSNNIKNNLSSKVHLFLAKLTDFHYTSQGLTVFYIPKEGLDSSFDDICKNNSLIERFEEIVIYWTKQLKTCLEDNKNIPAMKELIRPIDEYEFWAYRNQNLTSVQKQLINPKACLIQDILLNNHSSHIVQFQALCEQLNECIYEAESNINYLQLIIEPCKKMENLKYPKEFTKMFSKIINTFRVIWIKSPFYNDPAKLTSLYSYLSNQIILQCSMSIDLNSLFSGKTKKAMEELRECIACCVEYKNVYSLISDAYNAILPGSWNINKSFIFNHIEAFIQRCVDMLEVCNCMIIFGRIDEVENITMPRLGGTKGKDYEKVCEHIENKFKNALKNIQNASDSILNVQASSWYDHIKYFRNTIQKIEVVIENLLDTIFDSTNNVEEAIEALCSLNNYSRHQNLIKVFRNKISKVWELFINEISLIKENIITEKNKPSGLPLHSGQLINFQLQKTYIIYLNKKIESAAWIENSKKTEYANKLYINLLSIIDSVIGKISKSFKISGKMNIEKTISTTLISKHRTNTMDYLSCNINRDLLKMIYELFYWKNIGFDLSEALQKLMLNNNEVQLLFETIVFLLKAYNGILFSLSKNELQLLGPVISKYYDSLEPGIYSMKWNSDLEEYISVSSTEYFKVRDSIDLYKISNLNIITLVSKISKSYLKEDFSSKTFSLQEFVDFLNDAWEDKIRRILDLLKGVVFYLQIISQELIACEETPKLWYYYIQYYDYLIENALNLNLQLSMECLLTAMTGNALGQNSILKVKLILQNDQMAYNPPISEIREFFSNVLTKFTKSLKNMKKLTNIFNLSDAENEFYLVNSDCEQSLKIHTFIMDEVSRALYDVEKYTKLWDKYKHAWELPKEEFLSTYEKQIPSKSDIKKDISGFKDLQSNVEAQDSKIQIAFIEVDSSSLKKIISNSCSSWIKDLETMNKILMDKDMKALYSCLKKNTETVKNVSNTLSELQEHLDIYDKLCIEVYKNDDDRFLAK